MNDRSALMRAICAHPDEDTPRLAYADWLDENGNERDRARAGFIRLQIEIANQSVRVCTKAPEQARFFGFRPRCKCGACVLLRAEWQFLDAHGADVYRTAFLPLTHRLIPIRVVSGFMNQMPNVRLVKGFPDYLTIYPQDFFPAAGPLFAANPFTSVNLLIDPGETRTGFRFCWSRRRLPEMFDDLPPYDTDGMHIIRRTQGVVVYGTYAGAIAARDAAALAYGRRERDHLWKKGGRRGI